MISIDNTSIDPLVHTVAQEGQRDVKMSLNADEIGMFSWATLMCSAKYDAAMPTELFTSSLLYNAKCHLA